MKVFFTKLHYQKNLTPLNFMVLVFLYPVSTIYFLIVNIRNALYNLGIIKSYKKDAYTISVGNLTTGGTGKTPITALIANHLENVSILSNGYGGSLNNKNVNEINPEKHTSKQAGDEPFWLKENTNANVLTCKNRVLAADYAIKKLNSKNLILDDGFNHLRLKRDLDLLVIDSKKQLGNELCLPAGPLREPVNQIKRADKIILVNKESYASDRTLETQEYKEQLEKKYKKPVFICNMELGNFYDIKTKENIAPKKVIAFCAIAQPEYFYEFIKNKDIELIKTFDFADHHSYTKKDIENLMKIAKENNVEYLVTTQKDEVKIQNIEFAGIKILSAKLEAKLDTKKVLEK